MRKSIVPAILLAMVLSLHAAAEAAVDIRVSVPLPRLTIKVPPVLVVVPGTYVYAAPDVDADLVFFQGFWYRPYGGLWYRSDDYNGAWVAVPAPAVPAPLRSLPPDWKRVPPGHERMPYGQVKKNWHTWERERHWERTERRSGRAVGVGVEGRPGPGRDVRYDDRRGGRGEGRADDDDRGRKGKKDKKDKRHGRGDDDDDDRGGGRGRGRD